MNIEKVTIQDKEYLLKVGFGVMMEFEEQNNKPISSIKNTKDIINLIYITLKYNNEDFDLEYKYFVDNVLDNNPNMISQITKLLFKNESEKVDESKKK